MMYVSYIVHISNCGDAYVFFDPLDSCKSVLESDSQTLALHNGCQEVVSKGVLDRFVRLSQPSITLTFNTLGANNKNQQLSRGSKLVNAHQYITGKTLMKSQTSAEELRTRFRPCLGVRSVLGSWGVFGLREVVRKVKYSSVRIENPLLALNRGTECFSLARTSRTAWEGERVGHDFFQTFGGRSLAKCPWKVVIFRTSCRVNNSSVRKRFNQDKLYFPDLGWLDYSCS